MRKETGRGMFIALLALGGLAWAGAAASDGAEFIRPMGLARWLIVLSAAAMSCLGPIRRWIERALEAIRHPSAKAASIASLGVGVCAAAYLLATAMIQDRDLFPKTHDDCSYAIQSHMLAKGRLWMPQHPLADFFDSFYLITRPVYASQYFPGTALINVPGIWLGWPTWTTPLLCAAACVGLLYRILTDLVDGVAGLIGAMLLLSLTWFRMLSVLIYSQPAMLLLGLIMIWAWRRWTADRRWRWIVVIGAAAGWAAVTRPVDAICYALPVGACILHQAAVRRSRLIATLVLAAAPFLALQAVFNFGVTHSLLKTPFQLYQERDYPNTGFGFPHFDPAARPASVIPQKQAWYVEWAMPYIQRHQPATIVQSWLTRWLPMMAGVALPFGWMLLLLPAGLLELRTNGRWVLALTLPLFVFFYVFHTFFLEHYSLVIVPAVALLLGCGIKSLHSRFPRLEPAVVAAVLVTCLLASYALNPLASAFARDASQRQRLEVSDETFKSAMLRALHDEVPYASDMHIPAVILFKYAPGEPIAQEPVYNTDVAWPDDAPIIRAHDLGPRNIEIFRYYAQRQPERVFYRFDRATKTLALIGSARDLAAGSSTRPAAAP